MYIEFFYLPIIVKVLFIDWTAIVIKLLFNLFNYISDSITARFTPLNNNWTISHIFSRYHRDNA